MKNILFISYEFPPLQRIGAQRPAKFAKYLQDFGINPIVITLASESYSLAYDQFNKDYTLLNELPNDFKIIQINFKKNFKRPNKLKRLFKFYFSLFDDEHRNWFDDYKKKISGVISDYKPIAIYVTAPPFSIIETAKWTSKKFNLPLFIDMRDPWTLWRTFPYHSILHFILTRLRENLYFVNSKAIIATSQQTISDFIDLHSNIDKTKFHYIPNGFDNELINYNLECQFKDKIIVGYVGNFYYTPSTRQQMINPWWKKAPYKIFQYKPRTEDWLYRSPYFFLNAISECLKKYPKYKEKIKIEFAGNKPIWLNDMILKFGLVENFQHLGHLTAEQSFEFQKKCDFLLITSSKIINGKDYSIAGKTFEYLSFQKPIVAFVTPGAQKEILEQLGVALILDPDNIEDSVVKLNKLFENLILFRPNLEFIKTLHRKKLTKKLANIILDTK
jgi:hypothetical protein